MKKTSLLLFGATVAIVIVASCKKTSDMVQQPATENTATFKVNFAAPAYTLFSFKNNAVVLNTDSVSTKWDFAVRLTTFKVNSNSSGPGTAGVIMQDGIFDNVISAPTTGYAYDTAAGKYAIKDGSWYDYNQTTHAFIPKAGKVFIFRTADNRYAKMEILEATYDAFTGPTPDKINYKVRFVYQADGSTSLKK